MEQFVVVTVADNGVVHAWGKNRDKPYESRSQAASAIKKHKRKRPEDVKGVQFKVCRIMGAIDKDEED